VQIVGRDYDSACAILEALLALGARFLDRERDERIRRHGIMTRGYAGMFAYPVDRAHPERQAIRREFPEGRALPNRLLTRIVDSDYSAPTPRNRYSVTKKQRSPAENTAAGLSFYN
jgi:hypothetical protein